MIRFNNTINIEALDLLEQNKSAKWKGNSYKE